MFKKPSGARANIRKREEDGETETTTLTTKNDDSNSINSGTENSSNATNNAVTAVSQKNQNKRNSDDSDNDSDSDSDDEGINKEALHKSKKMRQSTSSAASASTTSSTSTSSSGSSSSNDISVKFESNKSVNSAGPQDMGATMTNQANPILAPGQASATGLKGARAGPMKGSANIRATVRFDYQMDVCKDYKETGYCGFGDTCIFMHDRGDYKTGWQLELEWQAQQKAKAQGGGKESKDSKDGKDKDRKDDDLPFACHICRKEFVNPVVTRYVSCIKKKYIYK